MKAHPYSFLTLILITLAFLLSGKAVAADIDATLPDSDNTSSFQVKNSESSNNVLMKVQSGGSVGIGTTTPGEKLDVNGNVQISGTTGKLVFPALHYGVKIDLHDGADEKMGTTDNQLQLIAGSGTTDNIAFFGDSTEVMRVKTGSGSVGIGTTDPKEKFQIGDRFTFNGQVGGSSSWRVISDNAYYDGNDEHDKRIVADFAAAMAFTNDGDILFRTAPSGSGNGILDNGDYSTWDTGTAPLFVQNDGKIGIGTDSPNSTLHVSGSLSVKRTPVASDYPPSGETWGTTIIGVTSVPTAGLTVTLPNAVEGRIIYIKDESGQAGLTTGQDITINTTDSQTQTIDGEVSYTISDSYGSLKVYSNGINWFIIGAFGGGGG